MDVVIHRNNASISDFNSNSTNQDSALTTTPAPAVSESDIWPWRIGLFGVGGTCVACVGVVCNITTIIVLAHFRTSRSKSSATFMLICLEIFDTIFLISEMFLENLFFVAKGGLIDDNYRAVMTPVYCVLYPLPHLARTCSAYTVVVITLERYIVVAWPLAAHRICRPWKTRLAVACVLIGSLIYHIPLYIAYDCTTEWSNETQSEVIRLYRTEVGQSYYYNHVHVTWLNLCVSFILPFLILLIFNFLMLYALWKGKRPAVEDRQQRRAKREQKLTIMVICMTAIFFLCELFPAISFIMTSGLNQYVQCSMNCNRFSAVADTMIMVNAAVNFGIYCASGKNFRDIFKQIFLRRPVHPPSRADSSSISSVSKLKKRLSGALTKKNGHHNSEIATDSTSSNGTVILQLRRTLI